MFFRNAYRFAVWNKMPKPVKPGSSRIENFDQFVAKIKSQSDAAQSFNDPKYFGLYYRISKKHWKYFVYTLYRIVLKLVVKYWDIVLGIPLIILL